MSSPGSELRVRIRQSRPITLDATLDCPGGELLALVGPSGSGKSTLLRMIAGLTRPEEGSVHCGDRCWLDTTAGVDLSPQARRVGYVPQHFGLFPHLSALGNVEAGLGSLPRSRRKAQARAWLEKVHLSGLEARRPAELSGGQQQRVALARALAQEPTILLLDEPFSAVDRATRETLYLELAELKQELALPIVMVTHDLAEALLLADRMTLLDAGRTLQSGTPRDVTARPVSAAAARLLGQRNVLPGTLIEHDAATHRSWIQAGPWRLASPHRGGLAPGQTVQWVVQGSAVRLPGIAERTLPEGPNRVTLEITRLLPLGEDVRVTARLLGLDEPIHFQVSARLAQALGLHPELHIDVMLREENLHVMARSES